MTTLRQYLIRTAVPSSLRSTGKEWSGERGKEPIGWGTAARWAVSCLYSTVLGISTTCQHIYTAPTKREGIAVRFARQGRALK